MIIKPEKKKFEFKDLKVKHYLGLGVLALALGVVIGLVTDTEEEPAKVTKTAEVAKEPTKLELVKQETARAEASEASETEVAEYLQNMIDNRMDVAAAASLNKIYEAQVVKNFYEEGTPQHNFATAYRNIVVEYYCYPKDLKGVTVLTANMENALDKFK